MYLAYFIEQFCIVLEWTENLVTDLFQILSTELDVDFPICKDFRVSGLGTTATVT